MQCLEVREIKSSPQVIDPEDFTVRQIFYSSRDGTRVPMTVIHSRDHDDSAPSPAVLTGYGGFNISSTTPTYSPVPMLWVQAGGVYAVANIRGGGEYGGTWHRAATLENRQKAFDDFIGPTGIYEYGSAENPEQFEWL